MVFNGDRPYIHNATLLCDSYCVALTMHVLFTLCTLLPLCTVVRVSEGPGFVSQLDPECFQDV